MVYRQDFDGFRSLFGKFINSTGPSVKWDKIEKLRQESVGKLLALRHLWLNSLICILISGDLLRRFVKSNGNVPIFRVLDFN